MYASSFGLTEAPFSISPDPRYLYMSQRHQEAMAHLRYGIQESGGFILLTGEVGTGKTTICRSLLEQLPENIDVAVILNPQIGEGELLAVLCDEIGVSYPTDATLKQLLDLLNEKLIETFSRGRRTVLVIDEAQMLTREVLEQVRILTNLETTTQKLLQIILIGQPELNTMLSRSDLRQLAQRITARYHLQSLTREETAQYIKYRLGVAGCHRALFSRTALRRVFRYSRGVPRLINLICDRAMLGAYSRESDKVTGVVASHAAREVLGRETRGHGIWWWLGGLSIAAVLLLTATRLQWFRVEIPILQNIEARLGSESIEHDTDTGAASPSVAPQAVSAPAPDRSNSVSSLVDVLNDTDAARSEHEALVRLLTAWGIGTGSPDLSCSKVETIYGLRCLKEQGDWETVQALNRVVTLKISYDDTVVYPLLTGLDSETVTFTDIDSVYNIKRSELDSYWQGEFLLLWRGPPVGADSISEDSQGVAVLWLRQILSRLPNAQSPEIDDIYFDTSLKEKVMAFQETNYLRVDGVAGPRTIIRLHNIVEPDVPKLALTPG